jgi:hypothetical protein
MLMGRMILRHHEVGAREFAPDAMFGVKKTIHGDADFVTPCVDSSVLRDFRQAFSITRTTQPGLSVVVPWLDDEDSFSVDGLTKAIAAEYMLPILRGRLVIRVEDNTARHTLDREALLRSGQRWVDESSSELLTLGVFASRLDHATIVRVAPADQVNAPKWPDNPLSTKDIDASRERLESGAPVAFEVPLTVHPKAGTPSRAHFRVHLLRSSRDAISAHPVFVREDITVTGARGTRIPGYVALVTIDDGPLATLLGDAENPAHTEWRQNTRGFKEKYKYPRAFLDFVRNAPSNLYNALFEESAEDDHFALGSFFPDSLAERSARATGGTKKKQPILGGDIAPPPTIASRPRRHGLRQVDGGFEVTHGSPDAERPSQLLVRVAYDVRRGDPLKRYEPYDFDFSNSELTITSDGLRITMAHRNQLLAEVMSDTFLLRVTGFDSKRDLYVRVMLPEV